MSTYCIHNILNRSTALLFISVAIGGVLSVGTLRAKSPTVPLSQVLIFIDPGHGGRDTGARGANGLLEKEVALVLGKQIEQRLAQNHTSRLSRNDDYNVDLFRRTETANSQRADLFIGLHTGGAYNYNSAGISIYYYLDSPGRVLPDDPEEGLSIDQTMVRVPWSNAQYRHAAESRLLAEFLQASLTNLDGTSSCRITSAPLLVLSAANMPAVLIEIGCLNDPRDEAKLADPDYLDSVADAICDGIENYLSRPPGITSIDLHE